MGSDKRAGLEKLLASEQVEGLSGMDDETLVLFAESFLDPRDRLVIIGEGRKLREEKKVKEKKERRAAHVGRCLAENRCFSVLSVKQYFGEDAAAAFNRGELVCFPGLYETETPIIEG